MAKKVITDPDPTKNVMDLVRLSIGRLDDLHAAETRRVNEKFADERIRINETFALTAAYEEKLRVAEVKRIDAIRLVDVGNVAVASERAAQQAVVLANQVSTSAETLRTLVASTAATVAQQLTQMANQLTERISLLEKSQYEGIGKGRVADPMMADLLTEVRALREARATSTGSKGGMEHLWGLIRGGLILIAAIAGFAIAHFKL